MAKPWAADFNFFYAADSVSEFTVPMGSLGDIDDLSPQELRSALAVCLHNQHPASVRLAEPNGRA